MQVPGDYGPSHEWAPPVLCQPPLLYGWIPRTCRISAAYLPSHCCTTPLQEKQNVKIRRDDLEVLQEHLDRWRKAVYADEDAGDVLEKSLKTVTHLDLLETLAAHFERCAASPEDESR